MDPSNRTPSRSSADDHRLPKSRILRGQKHFNRLFEREGVKIYHAVALSFRFCLFPNEPEKGCKVGFIVKRKLGKAAYRNKVKRLMREVYRRNQHQLCGLVEQKQVGFHGAFSTRTLEVDYDRVYRDMVELLEKTCQFIHSSSLAD